MVPSQLNSLGLGFIHPGLTLSSVTCTPTRFRRELMQMGEYVDEVAIGDPIKLDQAPSLGWSNTCHLTHLTPGYTWFVGVA